MKKKKLEGPNEASLYARKEKRTELGNLSKLAFGSRGAWLKHARKYGITLESIELQMRAIVNYLVKNETINENTELLERLDDESKEVRSEEGTDNNDTEKST